MYKQLISLKILILLLGFISNASADLIAHYEFENNFNDTSGFFVNSDGTGMGGVGFYNDPVRGNVLSLDGSNDYVNCGNAWKFDIDISTVAAWIKLPSSGWPTDWTAIVTKGDSTWRLQRNEPGSYVNSVTLAGTGLIPFQVKGQTSVADNSWHHVAGVYEWGKALRIYIDGQLDNSVTASGSIARDSSNVWIGGNSQYPGNYLFEGLIDDVRIYNHVLKEDEIAELAEIDYTASSKPSPSDGVFVRRQTDLTWNPGDLAVSQNVYLGTNSVDVANATALMGDTNGSGQVNLTDISAVLEQWLQAPVLQQPYVDMNDDNNVDIADFAITANNWLAIGDGIFKGHHPLSANTYEPNYLGSDTTYYWRVEGIDDTNPESPWAGDVWSFTAGQGWNEPNFPLGWCDIGLGTEDLPAKAATGCRFINQFYADGYYLNAAWDNDILVIQNVEALGPGSWQTVASEAETTAFINYYKTFPAVRWWSICDEPITNAFPLSDFADRYNWVKAADPSREVTAVFCGWGTDPEISDYLQYVDFPLYDRYPVYEKHSSPSPWLYFVTDDINYLTGLCEAAGVGAPIFVCQAHKTDASFNFLRIPTQFETRYMSFAALTVGARGVLFFTYELYNDSLGVGTTEDHRTNVVPVIIAQLNEVAPAIMSNESLGSVTILSNRDSSTVGRNVADVTYVLKKLTEDEAEKYYLIAANNRGTAISNVIFTISGLPGGESYTAEVLNEARSIALGGSSPYTLSDNFSNYEIHVYRIGLSE